jgi:hypothetical protein
MSKYKRIRINVDTPAAKTILALSEQLGATGIKFYSTHGDVKSYRLYYGKQGRTRVDRALNQLVFEELGFEARLSSMIKEINQTTLFMEIHPDYADGTRVYKNLDMHWSDWIGPKTSQPNLVRYNEPCPISVSFSQLDAPWIFND